MENGNEMSFAPVPQNAMSRNSGGVIARGDDQLAATQVLERALHGTFGKAGRVSESAQTGGDGFPFVARGLAVEIQINEIRGWLAIVPDQIAHQDVEHVVVDWNGLFKTRHSCSNE